MLEALGESQVIAYLERLAPAFDITLVSYEKPEDARDLARMRRMRERLAAAGIRWHPLKYHKWPPAFSTAYDVLRGLWTALAWSFRTGGRLVHVRGYTPALVGLGLKAMRGTRLLFDMRGFWADEKVDAGHWAPGSRLYRTTKSFERRFFESADAIVSLTHAGVAAFPSLGYRIPDATPIEVIPTCTDVARFSPGPRDPALVERLRLGDGPVVGCVGTMSNWYLREPMLDCLAFLQRRLEGLKVLVVTAEDHHALQADAARHGVDLSRLVIVRSAFADVPAYMRLMDVGMFFIKPVFSKKGSAATKLGEFLATGVPVVINDGIGDSGEIVRTGRAGVVLSELDAAAFEASLADVRRLFGDAGARTRCRQTGIDVFDLDRGVAKYKALYERLG
jgi:glycosyltransferase involved in cell wall biosynthesis